MDPQLSLSERLIERRLLSSDELDRVLKLQQEQQAPLSRLVVELGFLSEEDLLPVLLHRGRLVFIRVDYLPDSKAGIVAMDIR